MTARELVPLVPGATPPVHAIEPSGYWLRANSPGWRVGRYPQECLPRPSGCVARGPGAMELKRAIKLAENPEAVDAAICCLNRVIEDSRRDGRHQATVPQALYLRSSLHRKGLSCLVVCGAAVSPRRLTWPIWQSCLQPCESVLLMLTAFHRESTGSWRGLC